MTALTDNGDASRNARSTSADSDAGTVAGDGRDGSANERVERNGTEILQELPVTRTGTQIISGFLLTLAFQKRFRSVAPS